MKAFFFPGLLVAMGLFGLGCAYDTASVQEENSISQSHENLVAGDCKTSAQCATGESCIGIPSDGSTTYGKCHSTVRLPGEGNSCSATVSCLAGLSCTGLSMGPDGVCAPTWMVADYTNNTTYGTTTNVVAYGLATVPVDIVVKARTNLSDPSALTLRLTDPSGAVNVVCSPTTTVCTTAVLTAGISVGNSRDASVNGRWTLQVLGKPSPKISSWSLHLSSRWD